LTLTAKIRLDCLALGIQRIDAGPVGIAASLRPGAAAPAASDLISRSGDRLVYKQRIGKGQTLQAMVRFVALLKHGRPKRA